MSPYKMSKIEESIRITLKFIESINEKNLPSISALLSSECIFNDIWENTPDCITRNNIINYLTKVFASYPKMKFVVLEANNLVQKCIVKYKCYGLRDNDEMPMQCIGIFEVKNNSITLIDLYSKISIIQKNFI